MVNIQPLDAARANYNAVKIQVNDPKTTIPAGFQSPEGGNGNYNALNIEVNRPAIEVTGNPIYSYPESKDAVIYDMAVLQPANRAKLPAPPTAYQTTNFINNRTLINNDFGLKQPVKVPEPNVTTTEAQKGNPENEVTFHGINFKGENDSITKKQIEIIPPEDIVPEVDVPAIAENLASNDFDVQAKQIADIVNACGEDAQKTVPYVVTEIFTGLIDIINKDVSNLTPPNEQQIEIRKKIIINEIAKAQAEEEKQDMTAFKPPYELSDNEIAIAVKLSPMEQAERNKEYALYATAILAKVYGSESERQTGNVIPLTDMPGVSAMVDTLRYSRNSVNKVAAIDSLRYISRPEYKEELTSVLALAVKDENPIVARNAAAAMESLQ